MTGNGQQSTATFHRYLGVFLLLGNGIGQSVTIVARRRLQKPVSHVRIMPGAQVKGGI
jgi:hypothetical protein